LHSSFAINIEKTSPEFQNLNPKHDPNTSSTIKERPGKSPTTSFKDRAISKKYQNARLNKKKNIMGINDFNLDRIGNQISPTRDDSLQKQIHNLESQLPSTIMGTNRQDKMMIPPLDLNAINKNAGKRFPNFGQNVTTTHQNQT